MLSNVILNEKTHAQDQSLIVNRMNIRFEDSDCTLITFTNITSYKQLKEQEEMS